MMRFSDVVIEAFGYELPQEVVSSEDLEHRLEPLYAALHLQPGQLEAITGIRERRWWEQGYPMHRGATLAGRKAMAAAGFDPSRVGMLIYGGVCRDHLEPATACAVAHGLGLGPQTLVCDLSNACLGVLNGMVQVANAIALGQIEAGLVVSCESARPVVEATIARLNSAPSPPLFRETLATLTGGSGAVGVLLANQRLSRGGHRLLGGAARNAVVHHGLCTWGPDAGVDASGEQRLRTDPVGVLTNGVVLGQATFRQFLSTLAWQTDEIRHTICHQVGAAHQKAILKAIALPEAIDFCTFAHLGNMGSVSLPLTAAIAAERGRMKSGEQVALLGIGSGLNCLMLGLEW